MTEYHIDATTKPPVVREGKASIRLPDGVFYNRVQEFNRDLSVSVIQQFQRVTLNEWIVRAGRKVQNNPDTLLKTYEGLRILEALSATGIRSVRFALEVPNVSKVVANDLDATSVELIRENVKANNVSERVHVSCADAIDLMHSCKAYTEKFHVVDIDPFGTASPFLDAAMSCLLDGGLLCVTSTDMAVLCGSALGTSMGKYGGLANKHTALYETGLRILLNAIQSAASRYGCVIEPLLSLSVDFYARVFVRVWHSPCAVKAIAARHGICYSCVGCKAYHIQPLGLCAPSSNRVLPAHGPPVGPNCSECGCEFLVSGPLWIGPLHSQQFLQSFLTSLQAPPKTLAPVPDTSSMKYTDPSQRVYPCPIEDHPHIPDGLSVAPGMLQPAKSDNISEQFGTYKRMVGMLTLAYEELPDVVLGHTVDQLSAVLGSLVPPRNVLFSALLNAGYRVSSTHTDPCTFKTDAPMSFIWDLYRTYNQQNPRSAKRKSSPDAIPEPLVESTEQNSCTSEVKKCRRSHSGGDSIEDQAKQSLKERARSALLARPVTAHVDFSLHPGCNPPSRTDGLVRYQVKPEKYWGPKARPKQSKVAD